MPRPAATLARPLCLLAFAAFLVVSGCARSDTAAGRAIREQVLLRGLGADIADLDPHVVTGLPELNVVSTLFEGLVAEDPHDLHPVPGVAERWDVSDEGLVYTFHLRAGARWSNGDAVTAHDFADSFRRLLSPALAADNASLLFPVRNAEAYARGRLDDFAQVGIAAPDDRTLILTLERPTPHFLSLLALPACSPVHLPTIGKLGPVDARGGRWTRPENLVGNGPFVLAEWQPGRVVVVKRSPTYWDATAVRLNAIRFQPYDQVDAEELAFRAGQLHVTEALPVGKVESYRSNRPDVLRISPFLDTYFYRLNVGRPPLGDARVRRALALAIDRAAIVRTITRGGQQPASSFVPPGFTGYTSPAGLATDPAEARRLLAEAGFPGGRGLPALELLINNSGNHRLIAEAVQEMWRRELGVTVHLLNMEQKSLFAARRSREYQILRSDWAADYLDPATFLDVFASASDNNHTGWRNAGYDALLAEAARTADSVARLATLQRAEAILLAEAPIVPVYHYTTVRLVHPAVRGWYPTPLDHHPYKHVWLEE